jgi:flavin reductase (DIM6/NTAB) family NADH-FMN oxidoreductase RutF
VASRLEGTPYPLLRHLTLPIVAVTTSAAGRRNGFIVNSAQRASLVPTVARISLYVSKPNFSHDLVYRSGVFGIHLLRTDQFDVIEKLGTFSARDVPDKLADFDTRTGATGCPMLTDVIAAFECRVVNAMDAGGATFFLGEVVDVVEGRAADVMTSTYFREHAPAALKQKYEAGLAHAQQILEPLSRHVDTRGWPGAVEQP